jgi:hypothetical protein
MKRLLIFLTFLAVSGVAYAGDPTTDFLKAPLVTKSIALLSGSKSIGYTVDSGASSEDANGQTFRSNGPIEIRVQNFNPLTQTWSVDVQAKPDANYEAIKAFLDDLNTLQNALPQPPAPPPPPSPSGGGAAKLVHEATVDCASINTLTTAAYKALHEPEVTDKSLHDVIVKASGLSGVQAAEATLSQNKKAVDDDISLARADLARIRTLYSALQNQPSAKCETITAQMVIDYIEVRSTADQIIAAKETLSQNLGDLVNTLQIYDLPSSPWMGEGKIEYVIKTVTPNSTDQQNVSVTVKTRTVTVKGGLSELAAAATTTATFVVRQNSFFAAERAAAVIYNNLKYMARPPTRKALRWSSAQWTTSRSTAR